MIIPDDIHVYGDITYRGQCPTEAAEQTTFFNRLRTHYPDTLAVIAVHIRNEGKKTPQQAAIHRAQGMVAGAADILIPGSPAFVCELKRRDHTKSTLSDDQVKYLRAAMANGAFACIALGVDAAWEAMQEWRAGCRY